MVVQSDIGLICKSSGSDQYVVYTTDLVSARPKGGCKVRTYDRQNQMLAEASTDSEGAGRAEDEGRTLHRHGRSRRGRHLREGRTGHGPVAE